jgi:phosphate transport system protein
MALRSRYTHDLADLQRRLLRLAELVDRAIVGALGAFTRHNANEAERVIADDSVIDELRTDIEGEVLRLLANEQPILGSDLRTVSAVLLLANELERIGDYAKGIAVVVLRGVDMARQEPPVPLRQMAYKAREMLQQAIRAVVTQDAMAAGRLQQADETVDALYRRVQEAVWACMREQPDCSEQATYLLWIAHNLERIADRSVNIAERAAFIATGAKTQRHDRGQPSIPAVC